MLSKFKNFLKIYLRKRNFHQIHFESFQKSFEHFKEEDNKTTWNALGHSSGTYFIQLEANELLYSQKIQLVK